jgi:hypothetical protein
METTVEQQLRAQLVLARMANVQLTAQRDMLVNIMRQEMHRTASPNMFEALPMRLLPPPMAFSTATSVSPVAASPVAVSPVAVSPVASPSPTFASVAASKAASPTQVVNKTIILPPRPDFFPLGGQSDDDNVGGRLTPEQGMRKIENAMRVIRVA